MARSINNCLYCEILKQPRKYLDWIFRESDIALVGVYNRDIICIYKKHGELPGGHNINKMTDLLLNLKTPWEKMEYENHDHYRIRIDCKTRS